MANCSSPDIGDLPEGIECASGDAETDISTQLNELFTFPGEQYFNKIMLEKIPSGKLCDSY